jgi:hypothetical protein
LQSRTGSGGSVAGRPVRLDQQFATGTEALMKSILDPTFHYTPSASTDLRKTFARVRREMRKKNAQIEAEASAKVSPIFDRQVRATASRSR